MTDMSANTRSTEHRSEPFSSRTASCQTHPPQRTRKTCILSTTTSGHPGIVVSPRGVAGLKDNNPGLDVNKVGKRLDNLLPKIKEVGYISGDVLTLPALRVDVPRLRSLQPAEHETACAGCAAFDWWTLPPNASAFKGHKIDDATLTPHSHALGVDVPQRCRNTLWTCPAETLADKVIASL